MQIQPRTIALIIKQWITLSKLLKPFGCNLFSEQSRNARQILKKYSGGNGVRFGPRGRSRIDGLSRVAVLWPKPRPVVARKILKDCLAPLDQSEKRLHPKGLRNILQVTFLTGCVDVETSVIAHGPVTVFETSVTHDAFYFILPPVMILMWFKQIQMLFDLAIKVQQLLFHFITQAEHYWNFATSASLIWHYFLFFIWKRKKMYN